MIDSSRAGQCNSITNQEAQKSLAKLAKLAAVIKDVAVGIDGLTQAFKTLLGAGLV